MQARFSLVENIGHTSQSTPGYWGWSYILRCTRCRQEKLIPMDSSRKGKLPEGSETTVGMPYSLAEKPVAPAAAAKAQGPSVDVIAEMCAKCDIERQYTRADGTSLWTAKMWCDSINDYVVGSGNSAWEAVQSAHDQHQRAI